MPCYDKKLEAVRPNFNLREDLDLPPDQEVKEVDTVLATHELIDLIASRTTDFSLVPHYVWSPDEEEDLMMKGSPSGWGFMELMEQFVEISANVEKFHTTGMFN